MKGIGMSVAIVAVFILLTWGVAQAIGFEMSLVGSLALSVGLTLVLNLVLRAFRGRRGRRVSAPGG